jgi:hypothetical protein
MPDSVVPERYILAITEEIGQDKAKHLAVGVHKPTAEIAAASGVSSTDYLAKTVDPKSGQDVPPGSVPKSRILPPEHRNAWTKGI